KELGLRSRTVKKYKATTNSKHNLPVHENVLNRQFRPSAPNQAWVTDITYIPTDEGWLYLASIMDLYSRKIVGFHMDERMTKKLVLTALDRAYSQQRPRERYCTTRIAAASMLPTITRRGCTPTR
ncbi:transposase and inactivated derivative, partial [Paenibacillus popilliae ATCC 14706]